MKLPKDTPKRGDRCILRGREILGTLEKYDPETYWATVIWDENGPKVVHLAELKQIITTAHSPKGT